MADIFRHIFPDSGPAKKITTVCVEMRYVLKYGLGPYFKNLMSESVKKSSVYSLSFDESLREVTQDCEMVVMVRYWHSNSNTM